MKTVSLLIRKLLFSQCRLQHWLLGSEHRKTALPGGGFALRNQPSLCAGFCAVTLLLTFGLCESVGQTIELPPNTGGDSVQELQSGAVSLKVGPASGVLVEKRRKGPTPAFATRQPLSLQLLDSDGTTRWLESAYASVERQGESLRCTGTIKTSARSQFEFTDTYSCGTISNTILLSRTVAVRAVATNDTGFLTRFCLSGVQPVELRRQEIFIPGVWYRDHRHVPKHALAADPEDEFYLIREDRLPLPMVMMRDSRNGATLTLIHAAPDGSTSAADRGLGPVVDEHIQTASLGVFGQSNATLAIYYPCAEGERSYFAGRDRQRNSNGELPKQWAERFHPVQLGVRHAYKVLLDVTTEPDFPSAMRHAWRTAYQTDYPAAQIAKVNLQTIYDASIQLIAGVCVITNGVAGIPFRLKMPSGELMSSSDINFQMGFVGQQIPLSYHLLRQGLLKNDQDARRKGEAIMDFWSANSLTPEGLPRIWYDTKPSPHWRHHNTFLRIACDGMIGAVDAWDVMKAHGFDRPQWLKFCQGFGDWLVKHQNAEGSWCREYDWSGTPVNDSPLNTVDAIPFLAKLYAATGQREYRDVALRAGDWSYRQVHEDFVYVGGTADNPNVMDKEAGYLALVAFLALHDLECEQRWLDAARQAADFTETWAYSWNIPIPDDTRPAAYPKGCPTTAFSLIAAGHSSADLFLAGGAFYYYRLSHATGDAHYAAMATQFLYDTKLAVDLNGSLGYGKPGLCTEALTLAPPRGRGVDAWLPWLTYNMIEPLARLQDTYGTMEIPPIGTALLNDLRTKDLGYSRTFGLENVKHHSKK